MKKLKDKESNSGKIRINKFLSDIGYCSRREADTFIKQRRVKTETAILTLGEKIDYNQSIYVDGNLVTPSKKKKVYIAFNKPLRIVCTTSKVEKKNIVDYINFPTRIYPIGRLDKQSEGLIFLTNDGSIVNTILRTSNNIEKEYIVEVNKPITKDFIQKMSNGIPVLDKITKKCYVKQLHKKKFKIILTQGLNRQIRRMCEYLNYEVISLKRVRIMNIKLDVEVGKWRNLRRSEINELKNICTKKKP